MNLALIFHSQTMIPRCVLAQRIGMECVVRFLCQIWVVLCLLLLERPQLFQITGENRVSITIQKSLRKDVDLLAGNLRANDVREIKAFSGNDPHTALLRCLQSSKECWSGYTDNTIIGMFGVCNSPDDPTVGVPWMLASEGIYEYKRLFIKESKVWVKNLIKDYDALVNYVDARNHNAIRWLKWLGFDFVKLYDGLGTEGEGFWKFVMIKNSSDSSTV
jgi:hypothetical protein